MKSAAYRIGKLRHAISRKLLKMNSDKVCRRGGDRVVKDVDPPYEAVVSSVEEASDVVGNQQDAHFIGRGASLCSA